MVVASLRHRGDELLGQRAGFEAWVEKGSTFGVPLLYPWVNRLAEDRFELDGRTVDASAAKHDEHGMPMHGLPAARGAWSVVDETPERLEGTGLDIDQMWDFKRLREA